jgi:alpha-beta hydrolase superfamily lysophospholipase
MDVTPARERLSLWLRLPIYFVLSCCLVFVAIAAVLRFAQHSFIYHPRPYGTVYTKVLPKNGLELEYALPFGKQTAFFIPPPNESPKRIWIAFCGNGSLALDWTGLIHDYPPNGDGFLLIDYPGYGKNAGYATISSTRATADAALHVLEDRLHLTESRLPLCVLGHSLGSAAALDFAAHHRIQQIVLAAPFTSLREEVATIVGRYLARVLADNYDNRESLREILKENPQARIDVFHGTDDDVIPVRMSRTLAREFPMIHYHEVPGADHVTVIDNVRDQILAVMTAGAR